MKKAGRLFWSSRTVFVVQEVRYGESGHEEEGALHRKKGNCIYTCSCDEQKQKEAESEMVMEHYRLCEMFVRHHKLYGHHMDLLGKLVAENNGCLLSG